MSRDSIGEVFGLVDREVWIVTAADGNRRGGLVATWVSQASIDPQVPIVVAGIGRNHYTADLIERSGRFVLHLIPKQHIAHVWRFAIGSGREVDKFQGLSITDTAAGLPRLQDCLAWLGCRVFASYDGGDRIYYWADVEEGAVEGQGVPLRQREVIAAASSQQQQELHESMQRDIQQQRPLAENWRTAQAHRGSEP